MIGLALESRTRGLIGDGKTPNELSIKPEVHLAGIRSARPETCPDDSNQVLPIDGELIRQVERSGM